MARISAAGWRWGGAVIRRLIEDSMREIETVVLARGVDVAATPIHCLAYQTMLPLETRARRATQSIASLDQVRVRSEE